MWINTLEGPATHEPGVLNSGWALVVEPGTPVEWETGLKLVPRESIVERDGIRYDVLVDHVAHEGWVPGQDNGAVLLPASLTLRSLCSRLVLMTLMRAGFVCCLRARCMSRWWTVMRSRRRRIRRIGLSSRDKVGRMGRAHTVPTFVPYCAILRHL